MSWARREKRLPRRLAESRLYHLPPLVLCSVAEPGQAYPYEIFELTRDGIWPDSDRNTALRAIQ